MAKLFDTTLRAVEFATAGTQLGHHVITTNIANVDTPNYRGLDLDFQQTLRTALTEEKIAAPQNASQRLRQLEKKSFAIDVKMSHHRHAEESTRKFGTQLLAEPVVEERKDGNNLDVEKEMAKLMENSYFHRAYLELANRKFRMLKNAISGRV